MKKSFIAWMLIICMTSLFVLSGCSNTETETTAGTSSDSSADTTAGGDAAQELTVAINSTFATLDPALMSTTAMSAVYFNTGANFMKANANGEYEYELGESHTVSSDGLTYTMKIKDGIVWSDGEPLTAEHFVYGIKRTIGYGPDNAYAKNDLTTFVVGAQEAADASMDVADMENVGVKVIDDLTFEITLNSPCPYFADLLASNNMGPVRPDFAPEHDSSWSINGTYPCLGPMVLESIKPEEEAVYVKNDKYWNADSVTMDKITFVVMPDQTAQLNAFKAGEIDVALSVPSETAENEQYADNLYKAEKYCSNYFVLLNGGPKCTVEAFKDVNVRKALTMAIDRDLLVEVLGGGGFNVPLTGYIPYGIAGADGDFREEKEYDLYNLEEAKKLMEAAGYSESNPLEFDYLYSNMQFHADVAQMLQQMWSQIYVKVNLASVEGGVFYDYVDNGEFEACRYANNTSNALSYFKLFRSTSQIDGCQAIADPVYDEMVAAAYNMTDAAEYNAQLHKIEDYLVEEQAYVIPLLTQIPVVLQQSNLEGLWTTTTGSPYFAGMTVN